MLRKCEKIQNAHKVTKNSKKFPSSGKWDIYKKEETGRRKKYTTHIVFYIQILLNAFPHTIITVFDVLAEGLSWGVYGM